MNEIALATNEKQDLAVLASWKELQERAEFFAKSQLVPAPLRGKPADIAIILQIGFELGIPPMQALNGVNVIQGKPCISPQLMIALIRSKVPNAVIEYKESTEVRASVFMARSAEQRSEGYTAIWDDAKARPMGLLEKDNYKKQKGTMFRWRAVGEAARVVFPDVIQGLYLDIEVRDIPDSSDGENKAASVQKRIMGEPAIETTATHVAPQIDAVPAPASVEPEEPSEETSTEPVTPTCSFCQTEMRKAKSGLSWYCPNFNDGKGEHPRIKI